MLGNDLAGGKVMADPHVSCVPCRETMIDVSDLDLFPTCAKRDEEIRQLASHAVDEREASIVPGCFFRQNGVLMRKWRPPEVPASHEWKVIYQVVLPRVYRSNVLSLAHETPMAGHLGVN